MATTNRFAITALLFEGGLGVIAVVLSWVLGVPLWELAHDAASLRPLSAMLLGVVATIPLALALFCLDRWPGEALSAFKRFVRAQIVPMFAGLSVWQLGLLSLAAGVGEELLFRGLVQAGLAAWIGPPNGLIAGMAVASVMFGVCHWLTPTYAFLAALVGCYLGWLFAFTGSLLTPIVAHGLYDFIALIYLINSHSPTKPSLEGGG